MTLNMATTLTFRNPRGDYLFISQHDFDDSTTNLVLTDRSGEIIRSYTLPLTLENTGQVVQKAGWQMVDF